MYRKLLYIVLLGLYPVLTKGQDPQFSQFYANPLYLGPSFAGAVEGSRITGQYRNQWWDLSVPFTTYSASYDHYFATFNSGVGVNFVSDVAGTSQLGVVQIGLHYSYNFKVYNVWHIRPGLSFSYLQQGVFGDVTTIDELFTESGIPISSGAPEPTINARDIDAGFSALIYTEGFWIGASASHLLSPDVSLYSAKSEIPLKTSVYGGIDVRKKGKLLKPSDEVMTFAFLYKEQETIKQLDLGVYWYNYPIILGFWYRGIPVVNSQRGDAVVFLAGIKTRTVNIGYSYDFTISNLLPHTKGSHEVSFSYKFLLKKKKRKGGVPCPEF